MGDKLSGSFYGRSDVVEIAQELVGKFMCTKWDGLPLTCGMITETEAYCGRGDKACHANGGTRTARTETMYSCGGVAYIYLCYGIHHLFNVVTNTKNRADAVLVRAIEPVAGVNTMLERRGAEKASTALTAGPGRLTQALGITTRFDGIDLCGDTIWIEDRGVRFSRDDLVATERVGVDYAGDDASLPWRFYPRESPWISRK